MLYLVTYAMMHKFFLELLEPEELTTLMSSFNDVWITIFIIFGMVFLGGFFLLRFWVGKVTQEVDDINNYLEEINKKNYEAVLKIEHHLEFLRLTVLLKNIVKRLKNKK